MLDIDNCTLCVCIPLGSLTAESAGCGAWDGSAAAALPSSKSSQHLLVLFHVLISCVCFYSC